MRNIISILVLPIFFFITSCQVKESSPAGDLIAGHSSVSNKFTLQSQAAKTFTEGEAVTLAFTFPFDIVIDSSLGDPRVKLLIGGSTSYATYYSQSNTKELHFSYLFSSGDNDSNGIDIVALELNGSTLKFNYNGVLMDCNVSTITLKNLAHLKVDTTAPVISSVWLTNLPGLYNVGEKINFVMTFSEAVTVVGSPKFIMNLSVGGSAEVSYLSGSGSTMLAFSYTIEETDADSDGFDSITSPLDIGLGSIKDAVGIDASLDFSASIPSLLLNSVAVDINGMYPYVIDVDIPSNGTYLAAQNLDFTLRFNRAVTVSGTPFLSLQIGSNGRQAQYLSGSGTDYITFRYTTVPGDVDSNGITASTSIFQNGGNIVDSVVPTISYFTDILNNNFTFPATTGVNVNALQPEPIAVVKNVDITIPVWGGTAADNVWIIGQEFLITVGFNTNIYVNQTGGTPSIPLTVGATTRQATYLSGGNGQTSLIFRYVVQENDLDTDGTIVIGDIILNGGVISDVNNTSSLLTLPDRFITSTKVDGVRPVISTASAPSNGTYSQVAPLDASAMSFTLNWSEPVNYSSTSAGAAYLTLDIGGVNVQAEYVSGTTTANLIHRPSTLAGRNDTNGLTLGNSVSGTATIKDQAGNTANVRSFTSPDTSAILVDTAAPTVISVSALTANGIYRAGLDLDFSVTFSESVTTNVSGGYPRIPLIIGSSTVYLLPTSNSTSTNHTFRYTILSGQFDNNGVALGNAITHNGTTAFVRDNGRNNSSGTFTQPNTTGLRVDAIVPSVLSATGSSNKSYISGETIQISVTYSDTVTVDTTSGVPYITVNFSAGSDNFDYASGSGSSTLVFSRTLTDSHFDMDGLPSSITSITLNNGTLKDPGGNNAPVSFPNVDLSSVFVTYPQVKLWTVSNFVNRAPPTAPGITNAGALETAACGTGTCRIFDGVTDSLSLVDPLNGVDTVFLIFTVPASIGGTLDFDIFDTDVTLKGDTVANAYDLSTANGTINLNGVIASGVNYNVDMIFSSTNLLQIDFTSPQSFSGGSVLIPNAFNGGIGEVIAVEGILTATQKDNIRNYLDAKY